MQCIILYRMVIFRFYRLDLFMKNNLLHSYLSCDSVDDAIRSLAIVYGVEEKRIRDVYINNWPDFLPESLRNDEIIHETLPWTMAQHMKCGSPKSSDMEVAFYHRGQFDGTEKWFDRGLLNAEDGARAFLAKLNEKCPTHFEVENELPFALANIQQRTEGEGQFGGGPYAFDRLIDAKNAQKLGLDYSTPEFFCGNIWCKTNETSANLKLIGLSKDFFQPVIVKFLAHPICYQKYISNLWYYLRNEKFKINHEPLTYNFLGKGRTIPRNKIIDLITKF